MGKIKSIILSAAALFLSVSGLALANNKNESKSANAASVQNEFNAVFFHNTNVGVDNQSKGVPYAYTNSDNPSGSLVSLTDMHALNGEFTLPGGYTTGGTTNLTITEPTSTKKFTAIYVPVIIYAQALPYGYSFANPTITFTVNHGGWDDDNYSNVTLTYHGNKTADSFKTCNSFSTPNGNSAACDCVWHEGNPDKTEEPFTKTHSITLSSYENMNTDGKPHNTIIGFYSLFLYARKDSSSSHQLNFSMTAKISFDPANIKEIGASTSTKGYQDLPTAFANAANTDTIKVWKDMNVTTNLSVGSGISVCNYTLDLNGKTLTCYYGISIHADSSLTIKNGTIVFSGSSGASQLFYNDGTLTIESNVTISATSLVTSGKILGNSGTATINAATINPSSIDTCISNAGVLNLNGTNIVTPSYQYFVAISNSGSIYLAGNCVINKISQSLKGMLYGKYNSVSYTGNKIPVELAFTNSWPIGQTVAAQFAVDKLSFTYIIYNNRYGVSYSSSDSSFKVDYKYYDVEFNITGCTVPTGTYKYHYGEKLVVTVSASTNYQLPTSLTVKSNNTTYANNGSYYTFNNTTGVFTICSDFDCYATIYVSGSGIDVSPKAKLIQWATDYLHLSYTANEGRCNDTYYHYYRTAKMNLMTLGEDVVEELATSTDTTIASYRARYEAWASFNGDLEYCYENDLTHIGTNNIKAIAIDNNVAMLVVIPLVAISALTILVLIKKKKAQ